MALVFDIINAAAYTAVEKSEGERDLTMQINGDALGIFAAYCEKNDVPFAHNSAAYIFQDQVGPASSASANDLINLYGKCNTQVGSP